MEHGWLAYRRAGSHYRDFMFPGRLKLALPCAIPYAYPSFEILKVRTPRAALGHPGGPHGHRLVLPAASPRLSQGGGAPEREAFNATVYRDQLDEIEADQARGLIGKTEAEAARLEVRPTLARYR